MDGWMALGSLEAPQLRRYERHLLPRPASRRGTRGRRRGPYDPGLVTGAQRLTLFGLALTLLAAVVLLVVPVGRYVNVTYDDITGDVGMRRLVTDQRRVAAFSLAGVALQLAGLVWQVAP